MKVWHSPARLTTTSRPTTRTPVPSRDAPDRAVQSPSAVFGDDQEPA
jgi:hypothetical protein